MFELRPGRLPLLAEVEVGALRVAREVRLEGLRTEAAPARGTRTGEQCWCGSQPRDARVAVSVFEPQSGVLVGLGVVELRVACALPHLRLVELVLFPRLMQ